MIIDVMDGCVTIISSCDVECGGDMMREWCGACLDVGCVVVQGVVEGNRMAQHTVAGAFERIMRVAHSSYGFARLVMVMSG